MTDRLSTTALLMVLAREYPPYFFHCMALILLDIASHWLQMYSQLLTNKTSHKVPPRRYCSSRHRHAF